LFTAEAASALHNKTNDRFLGAGTAAARWLVRTYTQQEQQSYDSVADAVLTQKKAQQLKHQDGCRPLCNVRMLLLLLIQTVLLLLRAGTAAASWLVRTCTQQEQPLCG
jgi:hypothetical protein